MNDLIVPTGPVVVHAHNVFDHSQRRVFRGEPGLSIRKLRPATDLPVLCLYNGEYVLPEDEDWIPNSADHVAFCTLPQGGGNGNASSAIIGVVLIAVGAYTGQTELIGYGVGLLAVGLMPTPAVSALAPSTAQSSPSPTYSVQLSGNSARLGESIPVLYGRHTMMPDFASQPYTEFDSEGDQYYFAILCLGQLDKFTLESIQIDDTDLNHFQDVEKQFVGPNFATPLTLVNPAVVNAPEVASNDLVYGTYVGPFAACGPGLESSAIGIDIVAPKGLFFAESDGTLTTKSASWFVEARKITSLGVVAGPWNLLGAETLSGATNKSIRRSYKYTVTPGRYEVRVTRTTPEDTNNRAGHSLEWSGMRAYLTLPAPLEPSATFLALKIRATSQLSGLSQRRISVIIRRWLPTWDPTTGWSAPVETRSIAWAVADALKNTDYGGSLPDDRIDLQTLYELDQVWLARNDTFNGIFDKRVTLWAALQSLLRPGRARPLMRGSVITFIRDGYQELPTAMFNMRNIKRGSFNVNYIQVEDDPPDGVELQFFNEETWASDYARVPAPGVITSIRPANVSILGITNTQHALREAAYIAADTHYRRGRIQFNTELEGYLPCKGDLISVSHDLAGWGVSGDIEYYAPDGLAIVTEDLVWGPGTYYCLLTNDQGDPVGPFRVVPGSVDRSMQFLELPPTGLMYTGTERERTRYSMGPSTSYAKFAKILDITPDSGAEVGLVLVIEDNRVHDADAPYFGPPGGPGSGVGDRLFRFAPDGLSNYNAASDAERALYGYFCFDDLTMGSPTFDPGYTYDY